jgi:hypothetical protein
MLAGYAEQNQTRCQALQSDKDIRQLPRYLSYDSPSYVCHENSSCPRIQQLINNSSKYTLPVVFLSSCVDATAADLPLPVHWVLTPPYSRRREGSSLPRPLPHNWDRRAIKPNHIDYMTSSALVPKETPPTPYSVGPLYQSLL